MLCCVVICYIMLCYVMLYYVMLCYALIFILKFAHEIFFFASIHFVFVRSVLALALTLLLLCCHLTFFPFPSPLILLLPFLCSSHPLGYPPIISLSRSLPLPHTLSSPPTDDEWSRVTHLASIIMDGKEQNRGVGRW